MANEVIIKTRYRDIPFDEIVASCKKVGARIKPYFRDQWDALRGKPVRIITPAVPQHLVADSGCGGPWFRVADASVDYGVCPHIAEIGD